MSHSKKNLKRKSRNEEQPHQKKKQKREAPTLPEISTIETCPLCLCECKKQDLLPCEICDVSTYCPECTYIDSHFEEYIKKYSQCIDCFIVGCYACFYYETQLIDGVQIDDIPYCPDCFKRNQIFNAFVFMDQKAQERIDNGYGGLVGLINF